MPAWVKAVNTLDSMLGYRSKRVGDTRPSRRRGDVAPGTTSAVVLALACGSPRSVTRARAWLDGVPSPNSGWPMGTAAAALDVRLEKPGVYVLNPARGLADWRRPSAA